MLYYYKALYRDTSVNTLFPSTMLDSTLMLMLPFFWIHCFCKNAPCTCEVSLMLVTLGFLDELKAPRIRYKTFAKVHLQKIEVGSFILPNFQMAFLSSWARGNQVCCLVKPLTGLLSPLVPAPAVPSTLFSPLQGSICSYVLGEMQEHNARKCGS